MEKDDVEDIFKDFEHKITDKKDSSEHSSENISDEERLKNKYMEAEHALKNKYKREKEILKEKKVEEPGDKPSKDTTNIEKYAYIGIIIVLAVYIAIDLSFYHGKDAGIDEQAITASVVEEENLIDEFEELEEKPVEEELVEESVVEEKKLSGTIAFRIDNIYTDVPDEDIDSGYLNRIVFTIDNGKDKVLTPIVQVFAYDSELHESWETRSRGQYEYKIGINPGDSHTGSIDVSPKTFRNLELEKNIRLTLNDTEDGFIKTITDKILIE